MNSNNPFSIPNINQLSQPSQFFFQNNLDNNNTNTNNNNKNFSSFQNNPFISNTTLNNLQTNKDNKNSEIPFLQNNDNILKNGLTSSQKMNYTKKKEENIKNIFFINENEKNSQNDNNNIFSGAKIININANNSNSNSINNPFFPKNKNDLITSPFPFQFQENTKSEKVINSQEEKSNMEKDKASIKNNIFPLINTDNSFNFLNNNIQEQNKKEKQEKNIFNYNTNNINDKNKFNVSPKKQLEIIKEEEELKLKKESSNKEALTNENLLTNGENDSEQEKDKENNKEKKIIISNFNSKIGNEQKNKVSDENNLSNINEEKNENENIELNNEINNIENNNIDNEKENNIGNNINYKNLPNFENIINISSNDEEMHKIIEENNNQVDKLISDYHLNIINNMIDLNINEFNNKLNQFFYFCKQKINGIKILNDICNKLKEKIIVNYNILIEKQKININEYNLLVSYDQKLDYVISIQNSIINDLKYSNKELEVDMNSYNDENNKINEVISDNELNENINITNKNIKKLENLLEKQFNKNSIENLNNIEIPNLNENDNFFDLMQRIYNPVKDINKAFSQLLIESSLLKEKYYDDN